MSGAIALRAHVWAHNTNSRSFFEARGFMPDHTLYTMPLKEDGTGKSEPN